MKILIKALFAVIFICVWSISIHLIDEYQLRTSVIMTIGGIFGMLIILALELIDRLRI